MQLYYVYTSALFLTSLFKLVTFFDKPSFTFSSFSCNDFNLLMDVSYSEAYSVNNKTYMKIINLINRK